MYNNQKKRKRNNLDVSPNSLGGKIKKYRKYRNYTQEELGKLSGLPQSTAQIRIGQYETNKKTPGEDVLESLARGLGIEREALLDVDFSSKKVMYQALFELEDNFGLCPDLVDNQFILRYRTDYGDYLASRYEEEAFLSDWYEAQNLFAPSKYDTEDEAREKKKQYALWKASYPSLEAKQIIEKRKEDKTEDLESQVKFDNALLEYKGEKVKKALDDLIEPILPVVKEQFVPLTLESELIFLIKKMMGSGIVIKNRSQEITTKGDFGYVHFLSVKVEEILDSTSRAELYAYFLCVIQQFQDNGVVFKYRIICRKESFYIEFRYSARCKFPSLTNLENKWFVIEDYAGHMRDNNWSEEDIRTDDRLLSEHITGDNDHKLFS